MARKKKEKAPAAVSVQPVSEKKLEDLRRWRYRVARAKSLREAWEKMFEVERCEKYLLGKQKGTAEDDTIVVNKFLSTIKTIQPNLFVQNPKFFVRPKGGRSEPIEAADARMAEGILEAIGDQERNLESAVRFCLGQSFFRIGALKICYYPDMEDNPRKGEPIYITDAAGSPVIDRQKLRPMMDAQGQPVVDPQTGQPIPDPESVESMAMLDAQGRPMVEPDEVVSDESYRYQWVNAKNMLLPDEGPDQSRWTWVGEEVVVALEEAKDDTRFPARIRDKLKSNETIEGGQITRFFEGAEKERERLRYYECYDLDEKRIKVFADGQEFDDFMLDDDLPDGIENHPYALLLGYTPIMAPEPSPWPLPFTYAWLDQQSEYNTRRTQMTEGAKRSARKGIYTESTFDDYDEAIKILQSPKDMEFAKVTDAGGITMLEAPDLNASIYRDIPLLQYDWLLTTGQTGARLSSPEGATATEATFVERASNLRDVEMQGQVQSWLAIAGSKMLQRVKATLTLDMWIKLRGFSDSGFQDYVQQVYGIDRQQLQFLPGLKEQFRTRFGEEKWKSITREDIDFEADVTVVPGSSRPKNLESERTAFIAVLQIFGGAPQLLLSRELTSRVLRMFDMEDERLLDELSAVAQKMIQVNANQAGRNQGNGAAQQPGADAGGVGPALAGLAGMLSGANVRPA